MKYLPSYCLVLMMAPAIVTAEGFTDKTLKIIGGSKADADAWPATVAILNADRFNYYNTTNPAQANYQAQYCGGSLIKSNWVLTAAHCVTDGDEKHDSSDIYVLTGTSNLLSGGKRKVVRRIIVHPDYDSDAVDSDIALLELDSATTVATIGVSGIDPADNTEAIAVGWGDIDPGEDEGDEAYPTDLYQVDVPIINRDDCKAVYGSDFTENMMCAGYAAGGKDTCQSDSGGPLMINQDGTYVQTGITSWGVGCARPNLYGVYTRLSQFDDWIEATTTSSSGGGVFNLLFFMTMLMVYRVVVRRGMI